MKNILSQTKHILLVILIFAQITTLAQWTKTAGPPGITVNALYQSGNLLYAGTSAKGVFKSSDNGVTWSAANTGIKNFMVFSLFSDNIYLYAGTADGVYRSSNNGDNWNPANTGIAQKFVVSFLNANGFLFAGTTGMGVFKSSDHGNTWTDANGGALGSSTIHAITLSGSNIVVVADNNIFYSNDNGNSWFYPQTSPFILVGNSAFITHGDSILVSSGTGVYRSFNAGKTWGKFIFINDNISISGMVESGNLIYAGTASGMYKSRNFGKTWTQIPAAGLRTGNRFFNHFAKSGTKYLLAFDEIGVAYTSDKGQTWNYSTNGFTPASSIDNALLYANNTLYSGTHSDGVYKSVNNGLSWTKIGTGNNADSLSNAIVFSMLKINSNIILAGSCGYGLYRSADKGNTWAHITNGLPKQAGTAELCIYSLANSAGNILAGTDQGIYYSTNNGLTWHSTNITGDGMNVAGVTANDSVACAAVNGITGFNKFYRSVNKGVSWAEVFSVIDDFTTMASDGKNHFYAGSFITGYVSNNNGLNWRNFGSGITDGSVYAIAVKGNSVWAGNSKGVFFSNNNASGFSDVSTGLDADPNRSVQGFTVSSSYIFAGTFINGVWKRPLSDFGISALSTKYDAAIDGEKGEIKASVIPNPVVNEGILSYHVSQASPVIINLFDAAGRNIKTLVNAKQDAGNYKLKITGNNLAGGNYFAVVVIGNIYTTIKFTVVR